MPISEHGGDDGLPPPGTRSGNGAESVLPYLTKTLKSKPVEAPVAREQHAGEGQPARRADRPQS